MGETAYDEVAAHHGVPPGAEALRAGDNRLHLRYAWNRSPLEVGAAAGAGESADQRRLALRCDWLDLVTSGPWRYVDSRSPRGGAALDDRERDAGERHDVLGDHPVEGGFLGARLRARELAPGPAADAVPAIMDEELQRELRALGYLGGP